MVNKSQMSVTNPQHIDEVDQAIEVENPPVWVFKNIIMEAQNDEVDKEYKVFEKERLFAVLTDYYVWRIGGSIFFHFHTGDAQQLRDFKSLNPDLEYARVESLMPDKQRELVRSIKETVEKYC